MSMCEGGITQVHKLEDVLTQRILVSVWENTARTLERDFPLNFNKSIEK